MPPQGLTTGSRLSPKPHLKDTSQTPLCQPAHLKLGHLTPGHLHCHCDCSRSFKDTAFYCSVAWVSSRHSFRLGSSDWDLLTGLAHPLPLHDDDLSALFVCDLCRYTHHRSFCNILSAHLSAWPLCKLFKHKESPMLISVPLTPSLQHPVGFVFNLSEVINPFEIRARKKKKKHTHAQNIPRELRRFKDSLQPLVILRYQC